MKLFSKNFLSDDEEDGSRAHEQDWSSPVDTNDWIVFRFHLVSSVFNETPLVFEDLSVAEHPVAVEQEQDGGPLKLVKCIFGELIIKSWWLSDTESNNDSFAQVLVCKVEGSHWEKEWHAKSVHHSDVHDVQNT